MSRRLTLVSSVKNRWSKQYPYKKTGIGRVVNVLFIPRKDEKQYILDMYKINFKNLSI